MQGETLPVVVVAAQRGDRRAFAELYRRFSRAVHGVVLARVRYHEAPDIVQDVFCAALEKLRQLGEPAAFPGWLLAIARNKALDHARGKKPTELRDELPDLSVPASRASEVAQVLTALRQLPEAYQETMILRLVEGMSGPEIAEQTGLSPGSVRVNLHRGMKLLREKLGITVEEGGESDDKAG